MGRIIQIGNLKPETKLETRNLKPEWPSIATFFRFQVSGFRFQVSGFCFLVSGLLSGQELSK